MFPHQMSGGLFSNLRAKARSRRRKNALNRLWLEPLEGRLLLSGLTVSVPSSMTTFQGGELAVPITVAQLTDGTGDTGLSSAGITINYNSNVFTVADVKQGTGGQEASSLLSVTTSGTPGALKVSIAEQPLAIASVVGTGSGPIKVTAMSALPAGYSNTSYLQIQITGVQNFANANGVWGISVTGASTFTLNNSSSLVGTGTPNTGTYGAVIQGGIAGTSGGANNPSIVVVDFLAKTNAPTGSTPISLVTNNSAGVAFFNAADGVGYNTTLLSGSVNILASASAPKLGSFAAITPLSTLTGAANDPGISLMLDLPNGDIMANGGNGGTSNQWFLLTPDSSGNYADGTWSNLASSNIGRNSFGSAVLNNGQVMILGGEYTNINAAIASVVGTHTTPITVTTVNPLPTDLTSGNASIKNVAGFSAANGSFDITVTGPKTFTLNGTTGTIGSANTNTGTMTVSETNTGEIFTPPTTAGGTGTWQNMTSFPMEEFGDGNIELMNDGTVLAGYFGAFGDASQGQTYRYNEALDPVVTPSAPKGSNPWSQDATLPAGDTNGETVWDKLPDGSIVSVNIGGASSDESPQTATRLVFGATQAQDQWVSAGTISVPLGACGGDDIIQEMGSALLLPNGTLFQIGSSGNTAIYTPPVPAGNSTGTWVAGPVIPGGYAPTDAPGAVMPNGDVLFAAAPYLQNGAGDGGFNNSTELFEYNPTTNTIRQVPPNNSSGIAIADLTSTLASNYCFEMRMVDLPNGQVMFSDASGNTYVYSPNTSPNGTATPLAAWQPTISNIAAGTGIFASDFLLSGTQLNGISEGASYGDDAQMASNYPLVRLQSSSGAISFATTFQWSSAGVATGGSNETTLFSLPTGDAPGAYLVSVVANGIASNPALVVFMGGASSGSLVADANNSAEVDVDLAGKSALPFTLPASTSQVIIVGANVNQSITVNFNFGSRNITVNTGETSASDTEAVNIQQTGTGGTVITGGAGNDTFEVGNTMQNLSAIPGEVVIEPGTGALNVIADDTFNGGTSTYTVLDGAIERSGFGGLFIEGNYQSLSLIAGYAPENVNVFETPTGSTLNLNAGGGDDTVVIGSSGAGVADIFGPINVSNTPYYTQLTLNDAGDPNAHSNVSITNGSVTGLAPAAINYTTATNDVNSLTIDGNSTNNTYNISGGSGLTPVILNTGSGADQVNFVSSLAGTFTVNGAGDSTTVAVTDGVTTAQTYTVTSTGLTVSGFSLTVSNIFTLALTPGSGLNNIVDIQAVPSIFEGLGGAGSVQYVISNASVLPALADGLILAGGTQGGTITIDDSQGADTNEPEFVNGIVTVESRNILYGSISSLIYDTSTATGGPINIDNTTAGTSLTINAGPAATTINVTQANATGPVTINGGAGSDTVQLSTPTLSTHLGGIAGQVIINPGSGPTNAFVYDDENGSTSTYSIFDGEISRPGFGGLFINGSYQSLSLVVGYVPENVNIIDTPTGSTLNLNGAGGDDTVVIGSGVGLANIQGPINISNTPYYTQLILNDAGDSNAHSNVSITNGSVTGLAPVPITYTTVTNDVNSLTIDGNSTNNTYNISGGSELTPTTLNTGSGQDLVNFQSSLLGTYTINGAGSNTSVAVTDGASTAQTYTVTSTGLMVSGFTLAVSNVSTLALTPGSGTNNIVDIQAVPALFEGLGGAGSDQYLISNAQVLPTLAHGMILAGGTLGGTITIDDSLGTDTSEPLFASSIVTVESRNILYSGVSSLTYDSGTDSGIPIVVNGTTAGIPITINAGPGSTVINVNQTNGTGPVIIGPSSGTSTVNVSTGGLGAVVEFQATQQIGALTIGTAGLVSIAGSAPITLTATALTLAGTAKLDITSNTLKINFPHGNDPESTLRGYLKNAYAAGAWTGTGLTSSTVEAQVASVKGTTNGSYSIGYADGNVDGSVGGAIANQIVISPQLGADGNMDGKVDFNDLLILAQNAGSLTADWAHGDFNFDSVVDFKDLLLLAQNVNKTNGNTILGAELPASTSTLGAQAITLSPMSAGATAPATNASALQPKKVSPGNYIAASPSLFADQLLDWQTLDLNLLGGIDRVVIKL